jgi:hypothetical protein
MDHHHGESAAEEGSRRLVGASQWEQDLFDAFNAHVERESTMLDAYSRAAETTRSKAFAFIAGLLDAEERRHHELFSLLAEAVRSESEREGADSAVPYLDFGAYGGAQVRELTRRLLAEEARDSEELSKLHDLLAEVRDTTLWDLLVAMMRRDTDKHIAILEFVLDHSR